MFAGLPELGISNGEDLKETLTNCTEPLKAIDQFQVRFCLSQIFTVFRCIALDIKHFARMQQSSSLIKMGGIQFLASLSV